MSGGTPSDDPAPVAPTPADADQAAELMEDSTVAPMPSDAELTGTGEGEAPTGDGGGGDPGWTPY